MLRNIKGLTNSKPQLINKLKQFDQETILELTLENFLTYHQMSIYDFYGRSGNRTFQRMLVEAGLKED